VFYSSGGNPGTPFFFQCPFSKICWTILHVHAPTQETTLEAIEHLKAELNSPIFMSLIILLAWRIWMVRNNFIFQGVLPSIQACHLTFKKELELLQHRVKPKHKQHLDE